jgi:hypothetical protein
MNKHLEEKLDDVADTIYGKAMVAYLEEQINHIDTCKGIKSLEEALGREIAVEYIKKIINRITPVKSKEKTESEYE